MYMQLFLLLCNTRPSNSAAMGFSRRKLSETGLRIFGTFLKVQLCVGAKGSTGLRCFHPDDNRIYLNLESQHPSIKLIVTPSGLLRDLRRRAEDHTIGNSFTVELVLRRDAPTRALLAPPLHHRQRRHRHRNTVAGAPYRGGRTFIIFRAVSFFLIIYIYIAWFHFFTCDERKKMKQSPMRIACDLRTLHLNAQTRRSRT